MHQLEAPAFQAALNRALREAHGSQLSLRDDPMLPLGESHDLPLSPNSVASPTRACLTWTTHVRG